MQSCTVTFTKHLTPPIEIRQEHSPSRRSQLYRIWYGIIGMVY